MDNNQSVVLNDDTPVEMKLNYWSPVAIWTFKVASNDANCVCGNKLTTKCVGCSMSKNIEKQTCPVSMGVCSHGFHYHCISNWLNNGPNNCPICRVPWNFKHQNLEKNNNLIKILKKKNNSKEEKMPDPQPIDDLNVMEEID